MNEAILTSCLSRISANAVIGMVRVRDSMATRDDVRKQALETTSTLLQSHTTLT